MIDLGQPWSLLPRDGKHYGTQIVDRDGDHVLTIWSTGNDVNCDEPSSREKEYFGSYTPERWAECVADSHWECQRDLDRALAIIELINDASPSR